MSEPKFTAGPWEMAGPVGAATWIQAEHKNNIAAVHGHATVEGFANARLIAAAPDLFGALDAIVKAVAGMNDGWPIGSVEIYAARAALAKARGES